MGIRKYSFEYRIPPHKKWGAKSSSSAAKWLTIHQHTNAEQCFTMLKEKYEKILTTYLSTDSIPLYKVDFTRSIALVFGNEHEGVSEEIRKMADGNFIISQVGMIRSLNIQWLARLDLYEAFDQPSRVLCSAPIARG